MIWVIVCVLIVAGLFFSAFFSGAETGLYCVNRLRLHLGAGQRDPRALRIAGVLSDPQGALSVTLVGTNLMNYLTTCAVAFLLGTLAGLSETHTELYTVAVLTPIVFVFGEVIPKNLFRLHADALFAQSGRLLVVANRLFRMTGIVWGLKLLTGVVARIAGGELADGRPSDPKQRLAWLLREALAGQTLGLSGPAAHASAFEAAGFKSDLVDRVCRLSDCALHSVMIPRNRVQTIAACEDRSELLKMARRTPHAYLPVYETHRRHIIGLAKVDDLLAQKGWNIVGERVSPSATLNPHDTVASAIATLQRTGREMGVVTDRGGQMLGIVTLRDLIEAILGYGGGG